MSENYRIMLEDAIRSLAAIDEALGIGDDGCSDTENTLYAIAELKAAAVQEKREWVGLTDEDLHDLQIEHIDDPWANFKAIEAKLKEKNT